MKKILYIDLFSQYGHTNLNRVFIDRFENLGYDLNYIFRKGYIDELGIDNDKVVWAIPESYFNKSFGKFKDRVVQFKMLTYIKNNILLSDYDLLFFSFFEEISFAISSIKGNIVLMNHSNISGLTNRVKRFFLTLCASKAKILVFHDSIKLRFSEFGITDVIVEPLGLPKAYPLELDNSKLDLIRNLDVRLCSDKFKLFIPNGTKYNNSFISDLLLNPTFLSFLTINNILLIVKDEFLRSSHENILYIDSFLSSEIYESIFIISDSLLLHYPQTFEYKISAALFECFANYKPVFLSNIPSFYVFKGHFKYCPFYASPEELINAIVELRKFLTTNEENKIYKNLHTLNPTLNSLFQC